MECANRFVWGPHAAGSMAPRCKSCGKWLRRQAGLSSVRCQPAIGEGQLREAPERSGGAQLAWGEAPVSAAAGLSTPVGVVNPSNASGGCVLRRGQRTLW